ncbi:MAG: ribosome assembly RNA-binding protein YhbY [Burkholderiales bacterium]|jgi:RNA-binding protein|nr:ribosome assembly RNA-binding protein YhbY [Burkholderiales bacterium]
MAAMKSSTLAIRDRKRLRQIAHHLHPVVTVGEQGVSDALVAETERALSDHELIKVKVHSTDREERAEAAEALAAACNATIVQTIGKIVVLYRRNPEATPRLSNLARFGAR